MEVTEASVLMLPFTASSVGVARRRLVSDLLAAGVYDSAICDVALVISELLSNALRHAGPLPGAQLRVAWRIEAGNVQVAVSDGGGETQPELGHPTLGATGGRGLRIVAKLATSWGAVDGADGMTVWADIPVGSAQAHPQPRPQQEARTEMTTVGGSAPAEGGGLARPPPLIGWLLSNLSGCAQPACLASARPAR